MMLILALWAKLVVLMDTFARTLYDSIKHSMTVQGNRNNIVVSRIDLCGDVIIKHVRSKAENVQQ